MSDRYEISAQRWALIEPIVSPPQRMGRPRRDDRQMLNSIFWILCSGAKWRDLPEHYGPWKTVHQRFRQWRDDGTFERVLRHLHLRLREDGLIAGYLDGRLDLHSSNQSRQRCWKKGRAQEPQHHCLGRSRGGLNTKIHLACDCADSRYFMPLLEQISLSGSQGRPRSAVDMSWPAGAMTVNLCASIATDTACGQSFLCARCTANRDRGCRDCSTSPRQEAQRH